MSSIKLVFDTYILEFSSDSTEKIISYYADLFFTVAFIVEMLIKVIALGFAFDSETYIRDS